jgi:pimeloyl-ACP methyl ester carboxylesterase
MRAVEPAATGLVEAPDGVRIAYEVFGAGDPTIVFLRSGPIVHSRQWKGQVPYLSRHYRVIAFDGRGNGRSDRPTEPDAYCVIPGRHPVLALLIRDFVRSLATETIQ